ncbi:hypothetical protein OEIGOIKO_07054 [Streptomyces chrestomyceticus JCM 4735]|uniref:Uncharacterized protein n=1 Tax=Streptomyces chrestomyceticus JCM 4735 TaxID=1306181 RepID=A0A7U9L1D0_9ACTN|nr:hypothetical protein OEIGOIKO_07054 [Streptomyces chrestomyceticus JCM 4735]
MPETSYFRTDSRLVPEASPSRSLATNTPAAAPPPVAVTPSLSGRPEPPGKRRALPEPQPRPVSGVQPPEALRTRRHSLPLFWAAHRTLPSWWRPLRSSPKTPAASAFVTAPLPGHAAGVLPLPPQLLAAPRVTPAALKAPVPSGQRDQDGAECLLQEKLSTRVLPSGRYRRALSSEPSPKLSWTSKARKAPGASSVPAAIVYVEPSLSSLRTQPEMSTVAVPLLYSSTESSTLPVVTTSLIRMSPAGAA